MKIFRAYLRPYMGIISTTLIIAGIAQVMMLFDSVIFGKIIDYTQKGIDSKNDNETVRIILLWLILAAIIALASRLLTVYKDYLMRLIVQKFGMQIFNDGLKQTIKLPYTEFESTSSGEILALFQKVRIDTERFISSFINVFFTLIVGVAFLIWYAITKHWVLIPVFAVGVITIGGLTCILSRSIKILQRSLLGQTRTMSGTITESLRNIELIKSLGLSDQEIIRLRKHTQEIYDLEMEKVKRLRSLTFYQGTLLTVLRQSILFILLWLIFRKVLTPGELISMQYISTTVIWPLQYLGSIMISYREAEASLTVFNELMNKKPEYQPKKPVNIGAITSLSFNNVTFKYNNAPVNAIEDISFEASLGNTIAFAGPSGSGKSTLVKLLAGLYEPVKGDILYDGISSHDIFYNTIRKQLGFVTQDTQLFSGTIRENMQFVKPSANDREIYAALELASALPIIENGRKGLDLLVGECGKKLSGGEKQRLSIARALLRKPRLLIFDEATSALDSITEEQITETIRDVSFLRHQITLLISHRLSTIMHADMIYVLENGRIIEKGTHNILLGKKGLYYAMWRQQIGERKLLPVKAKTPVLN